MLPCIPPRRWVPTKQDLRAIAHAVKLVRNEHVFLRYIPENSRVHCSSQNTIESVIFPISTFGSRPAVMLFILVTSCIWLLRLAFSAGIQLPAASTCKRPQTQLAGSTSQFACTDSIDWIGDGYNNENCRATIQRLYNVEVTKHKKQQFEFLLPGASNKTDNPVMQTPRKYIVGKS